MKISLPLWIKVWLLLALNFALVAALGASWFLARSERGWERLAVGPLGDRVSALADRIADELWNADAADASAALQRATAEHGVEFIWLRNDGLVLGGPSLPLPSSVRRELTRGNRLAERRGPGPGPGRGGDFERPDPPPRGDAPGRFLLRTDSGYWFGVRLHPSPEELGLGEPPPRTTLILHTDSTWRFAWLLGLQWWLGVAALALGVSVLFWLPFVRSTTRRLDALTTATGRIAEGRFETRTGAAGQDEIGRLGGAIDRMAQRLETHAELQKKFLGDVAHELGSPLGRLQVAVEILEQRAGPTLRTSVADVREEVKLMAELVGELLAFTRAGLRPREAALSPVSVADIVRDSVEREGGTGRVRCAVPEDLRARADEALLRRAVGNLIRNALRYGGDGAVTISALREAAGVVLRVEDEGPGVPPEALGRLGEPFFRPESARQRETGGVGLGLTIVRSAVTACGGEVRFANREPHGFLVEVRLASA